LLHRYKERGYTPIYLDETGFEPDAPRLFGWGLRGKRVYGIRSGNSRPRTSLLLAKHGKKLIAPLLFAGTCNAALFNTWVEKVLLPDLPPKSLVIMDNATFHKQPLTRELIERAGHKLLYLAPYSPDHNPIEQVFATLKANRPKLRCSPDELMSYYLWE